MPVKPYAPRLSRQLPPSVYFHPNRIDKPYKVQFRRNRRNIYLGWFASRTEAMAVVANFLAKESPNARL